MRHLIRTVASLMLGAALVAIPTSASARAAPDAGTPTAMQAVVNIRVSRDSYAAHAEPSLAVNPRDPRNLLGAAQLLGRGPTALGTFTSFDGGHTWRDNGPLPLPPGTNTGDDVTVAFDGHGDGYVAAMATSWTPQGGLSHNDRGVYVWRTDDGGRTFHPAVAAMRGQFADHPWLAVDATAGLGGGNLYVAWVAQDHATLGFSRSTNGGRGFTPWRTISAPPGGVSIPVVSAGPHGAVYVAYESGRHGADAPTDREGDALDNRGPVGLQASRQGWRTAPPHGVV